jgi:hypothetical protein
VNFYRNIIFGIVCLMFIIFSGCAPEENDLIPPDAAFTGPGIDSPTNSTGPFSLSGTMDAGSTVEVDVTTSAVVSNLLHAGTAWSFDVTDLIEGENIILVSVADEVGNTRTIQMTIVVDITAPETIILQYPVIAQPENFTFAGTVEEDDSSVFVEVYDSSSGLVASKGATVDADIWHVDLDLSLELDGIYTVVAIGKDRLDNEQESTDDTPPAEQEIELDSARPSFVMSTPTPVILATTVVSQVFVGTTDIDNDLTVTPSSSVTQPDGVVDWSATVSGIVAGNTVVTFDVSDGTLNAEQKVLIVRDQTAPTVVEWSSTTDNSVSIEFNESMNAAMIEPTNLTILDSTSTVVNVLLPVTPNSDRKFTFATDLLTPGETYTATLQTTDSCILVDGCTVEDLRGNSLVASYSWTFKK